MARQARLDAPGLLHHLIVRGTERRTLSLEEPATTASSPAANPLSPTKAGPASGVAVR